MSSKNQFGFGMRLKAARKAAGLSGTELGKNAGENGKDASKASVSDWENDRHYPKADQLRVICLKLNISADHLVFGDIRDQLKFIQAQSAVEALSPEQRRALLERMVNVDSNENRSSMKPRVTPRPDGPVHTDTLITEVNGHTQFPPMPTPEVPPDERSNPDPAAEPEKRRKRS
jgi:transcriptional regulator with XRE-family HTH domain